MKSTLINLILTLGVLFSLFALFGNLEQFSSLRANIDQSDVCLFDTDEAAKQCKDGQLSFFKPRTFGNEQLPLIVAVTYCDFNHQIVQTNGGVVCVFTAQRLKKLSAK